VSATEGEGMAGENLRIVAYRILEYLVENPDAQDTVEGIVRWWLSIGSTRVTLPG
jgi:hypothetical protein